KDTLTETRAVVASPPMIEVAAQGKQTIRLVRTVKSAVTREESYRILVDEIVDASAQTETGVNVKLRYSIPVFAAPANMKAPRMTVAASVDGPALLLKAQNSGGQHVNLSAVSLVTEAGQSVTLEAGLVGYVLSGQAMEWKLALPPLPPSGGRFVTLNCRF